MIVDNCRRCMAIELMSVCQAVYLRGVENMSPCGKAVYELVRKNGVPDIEDDIVMSPEFEKCETMIEKNEIVDMIQGKIGLLD